jgi:hypothetical protein
MIDMRPGIAFAFFNLIPATWPEGASVRHVNQVRGQPWDGFELKTFFGI